VATPTLRQHLLALCLFAAASLLLTWPLAVNPAEQLPAYTRVADDDLLSNIWAFWWTRRSVLLGQDSFWFTHALFFPEGAPLTMSAVCPPATLPFLPILAAKPGITGVILSWNLNVLLTFFLSCAGTYLLALRVCRNWVASVIAALLFGFSPFRFDHLRHVNLSVTQWLPFTLWAFLGRMEHGGLKWAAVAAIMLALVITSSATYFSYLVVLGPLWLLAWLVTERKTISSRLEAVSALLLPGAVALVLSAPVLLPTLRDSAYLAFETPIWEDPISFAYPVELFLIPRQHPYIGLCTVVIVLLTLFRRARAAPYAVLALSGLAFAPGPYLKTIHGVTGIPLPYELLRRLVPPLSQNRFCERFLIFWWLGAAVLVSLYLAKIWDESARGRRQVAIIALVLLLDIWPVRFETSRPPVPRIYAELSGAPAGLPVYDWPADYKTNRSYMYYQLVHERPICQGHLSRRDLLSYQNEEADAVSFLREFILVMHHEFPAGSREKGKLDWLHRRYDWVPFTKDAQREVYLLHLKRKR
jgi:hypothetical protein